MSTHPVFDAAVKTARDRVNGIGPEDAVAETIADALVALFNTPEAKALLTADKRARESDTYANQARKEAAVAERISDELTAAVGVLEAALRSERAVVTGLLRVLENIATRAESSERFGLAPGWEYWCWVANRRFNLADQALRTFKARAS